MAIIFGFIPKGDCVMSEKVRVDDNHYRIVEDDGKTSRLYETDGGLFGPDTCVEVADHHPDGTTTAYEPTDPLFTDGRGKKK